MFYLDLFEALNRHQIRYLVVGGLAVNLHGVPRLTLDVDIAVDATLDQSAIWEVVCKELNARPRQPVTWKQMYSSEERERLLKEKNLVAFGLLLPKPEAPGIDILFTPDSDPPWDFAAAYNRRVVMDVEGVSISLASIKDIVAMKTAVGRTKDLQDISHLRKVASGL